jgi:hypothetical protein
MECEEIACDKPYKTRDPDTKECKLSACGVDYEERNYEGVCKEKPCELSY